MREADPVPVLDFLDRLAAEGWWGHQCAACGPAIIAWPHAASR